jgi:hypothetical protein
MSINNIIKLILKCLSKSLSSFISQNLSSLVSVKNGMLGDIILIVDDWTCL